MATKGQTVRIEELPSSTPTPELARVVRLHAEAPIEWGFHYEITDAVIEQFEAMALSEKSVILVNRLEGTMVAFIWFQQRGETDVEILSLWVHEEHRQRGLATELKRSVERWCQEHGRTKIVSTVFASNDRMLRLNEKLGYHTVCYHMEKTLD